MPLPETGKQQMFMSGSFWIKNKKSWVLCLFVLFEKEMNNFFKVVGEI